MASLPGFSPIRDANATKDGTCFLGMIVEIKAPYALVEKGRSSAYILDFTLQDHFSAGPQAAQSRLKCSLKRGTEARLPKGNVGDIAILRRMKMVRKNEELLAVNLLALKSEIVFFPDRFIPTPEFSSPYSVGGTSDLKCEAMIDSKPPSPIERLAVIDMKAAAAAYLPEILKQSSTAPHGPSPHRPNPATPRNDTVRKNTAPSASSYNSKKQALIRDMEVNKFYNLVGEVVKMFWQNGVMDLYITDYTENKDLFLYTDPNDPDVLGGSATLTARNWTGPYGQLVLLVRLWDNHVGVAQSSLNEGDIAFLQNVRIKFSPDNHLEGAMSPDLRFPGKRCVHKCMDAGQISQVMQRKEAYERGRGLSPTHNESQSLPDEAPVTTLTKSQMKKKEKKEKNRLQKELEQQDLQKELRKQEFNRLGLNNNGVNIIELLFCLY